MRVLVGHGILSRESVNPDLFRFNRVRLRHRGTPRAPGTERFGNAVERRPFSQVSDRLVGVGGSGLLTPHRRSSLKSLKVSEALSFPPFGIVVG